MVGLRSPMCRIFLPGKLNANPLNILVHLQRLCAQRGKELEFCWQVESSSKQSKAHSWVYNTYQFKVLLHRPLLGRYFSEKFVHHVVRRKAQVMGSKVEPIESPNSSPRPFGGHSGPLGVENGSSRNVDPHSYSTSMHTLGLSCTVWSQYTTRQTTDRHI